MYPPGPQPPCPGDGLGGCGRGGAGLGTGNLGGSWRISSHSPLPKPPPKNAPTNSASTSRTLSLMSGGSSFLSNSPPNIPPIHPPITSHKLGTGKGPQLRIPALPCMIPRYRTHDNQSPICSAQPPAMPTAHCRRMIPTIGAMTIVPEGDPSLPPPHYPHRHTG